MSETSAPRAFQDDYPDDLSHCYGCGRLNEHGHRLKSYWEGEETVATFRPRPYHTAIPGYVYGGLLASLIDCHGTGSASAAAYKAAGREPGTLPPLRFLTAALEVEYLKPTPLGVDLVLRGEIVEVKPRKVVVAIRILAEGVETVRGKVIAVLAPEALIAKLMQRPSARDG